VTVNVKEYHYPGRVEMTVNKQVRKINFCRIVLIGAVLWGLMLISLAATPIVMRGVHIGDCQRCFNCPSMGYEENFQKEGE
jgi:hypothetical protein